jgi:hypothetical protein
MNQKTSKLIRKTVEKTHAIDRNIEVEGVQKKNPQFKKICNMIKKEYKNTPQSKKSEYKKSGI